MEPVLCHHTMMGPWFDLLALIGGPQHAIWTAIYRRPLVLGLVQFDWACSINTFPSLQVGLDFFSLGRPRLALNVDPPYYLPSWVTPLSHCDHADLIRERRADICPLEGDEIGITCLNSILASRQSGRFGCCVDCFRGPRLNFEI